MNKLIILSDEISALYELTKTIKKSDCFSLESAKSFNEGSNFAYKNVLKLIQQLLTDETKEGK